MEDMYMDMDPPPIDELEWLEAQYREEADLFSYPPEEEEEEEEEDTQHLPAPLPDKSPLAVAVQLQSNRLHKRSLPLQEDRPRSPNEKRIRIVDHENEDWLRYSPPPQETNPVEQRPVTEPEEIIVSRFASKIDGECIPVTGPDCGDRVYTKLCRFDSDAAEKRLHTRLQPDGLLLEPLPVLLQRWEEETLSKSLLASSEDQNDIQLSEPMAYEKLWVDKYAPNSFTELLSDEQTNREVLLWLKQWDSCVFGSEIRSTGDEVFSALRRHSSIAQQPKGANANFLGRNKGQRWSKEDFGYSTGSDLKESNSRWIQESLNKNSRVIGHPEHKILLLCGPPGLGKTTLAHVAAKHCGYRPVEINASDDRSSATIEAKILDVIQMNSVMIDSKPKCLIIDEIDGDLGDGKGAVEVILKMVSADRKFDAGKYDAANEEQSGKHSSRKRQRTSSLLRPVICICNDLYAPVLRPLRQISKVHMFVQPSMSRVVSRLKYICNKEKMKTSSIALASLVEYTECDIRSCLNTLQFLYKRNQTLNVVDISSQVVGRKDISRNIFDIWKEIFQKRKSKHERSAKNGCCKKMSSEFDALHHLISSRGDYDLVFDGIHENILQQQYHDPSMQKTVVCLNDIGVSDLIHQYTMHSQQMHMFVYHPPLAIAVHHQAAQVQRPNIEWPKSYQRYRTTLRERMEALRTWQCRIPPHISRHMSTKSFVEDLISPLLHILSPPNLRPVAMHLLSEKEKNDLTQLISRMVSYCISYKNFDSEPQTRNQRAEQTVDASSLAFDPPICDYISFKDYVSSHHALALAIKQMLLHEVESQKILQGRTDHVYAAGRYNKENKDIAAATATKSSAQKAGIYAKNNIDSNQNKLNSVPSNGIISTVTSACALPGSTTDVKVKTMKDVKRPSAGFNYFDRFRKSNSTNSQRSVDAAKKSAATLDSHPLLFKFNEGFTNAIKRPMRIREFLL